MICYSEVGVRGGGGGLDIPSKQGTSPERSERPFRSAVRPHCNVRGRTFGGRPHLVLFLTFAGGRFEDVHLRPHLVLFLTFAGGRFEDVHLRPHLVLFLTFAGHSSERPGFVPHLPFP